MSAWVEVTGEGDRQVVCHAIFSLPRTKDELELAKKEGKFFMLPGDKLVVCKETKDWLYGWAENRPDVKGIFPKTYVRLVGIEDETSEKVKTIIENFFDNQKMSWLQAKEYLTDAETVQIRHDLRLKWEKLMDLRRARMVCHEKFSSSQLKENSEEMADTINEFPPIKNYNVVVDNQMNNLTTEQNTFTEVYKVHRNRLSKKSVTKRYSKDLEKNYHVFSMKEIKPPKEAMEFGKVDYTVGLFSPITGFVTDFFSYEDMNKPTSRQSARKKFAFSQNFHEGEGPLYLVMMVIFTDTTQAKKCKGTGVVELKDVSSPGEIVINTIPNKDSTLSVVEHINKTIKDQDQEQNYFRFTFQAKSVPESSLKVEDFVFKKIFNPTLFDTGINYLSVNIDSGKILGSNKIFMGDTFSVSIDVEVVDGEGNVEKCIKTCNPDEKASSFQTLTAPNNLKCDWKENFYIHLRREKNMWKNHHLRLNIYKHPTDRNPRKLYGFSYLPLKDEDDTILSDDAYQLFVFQIHKGCSPQAEDYLKKGTFKYERNMKSQAQKALNDRGYSLMINDILTVKTRLFSTEMTDDPNINGLLALNPEEAGDRLVDECFRRYITMCYSNTAKRILFMTQILDKLWHFFQVLPEQARNIFESFVVTIHPVITNKKDYGYASDILEKYLEQTFNSPEVFHGFISSFTEMLADIGSSDTDNNHTYTMMSMNYIFKFIVKSFHINKEKDASFDPAPFRTLIESVGAFLLNEGGNKMVNAQTFRTLFEIETINTVAEVLPDLVLINILTSILEKENYKSKDANKFLAIGNILQSSMFQNSDAQQEIFNSGLKLVRNQFPVQNPLFEGNFAKGRLRDVTLELIQRMYEACKSLDDIEIKTQLIETLVLELLPDIISIIPAKCEETVYQAEKLEDILLIALLSELTDGTFKKLIEHEMICSILKKVFRILQRTADLPAVPQSSFDLKMFAYKCLSDFFHRISQKGILVLVQENLGVVEEYIKAVTAVICAQDLDLENFTTDKAESVLKDYGDIRVKIATDFQKDIKGFSYETVFDLLRYDTNHTVILEALYQAGSMVNGDARKIVIQLLFYVIVSEFFAKDKYNKDLTNKKLDIVYKWFMEKIIDTFRKEINFSDSSVRDAFKGEFLKSIEEIQKSDLGAENLHAFNAKIKMIMSHIEQVRNTTFDCYRVEQKYKVDPDGVYFANITVKYNLYSILQKIQKEAVENNLLDSEPLLMRDLCMEVLIELYEIYDRENLVEEKISDWTEEKKEAHQQAKVKNSISAGYTLQKLGDLMPWSLEKADRQMYLRIENWITHNKVQIDEDRINSIGTVDKRATVSMKNPPRHQQGFDAHQPSWSELKDAVQKLAIRKFEQASGFECSIEMMETSIERYKSEIFDFKELSNAYANMSKIYKYRYDFVQKLQEEEDEKERKRMETMRRNITMPEYYRISFYNTPVWLGFLKNDTYIYRADALQRLGDVQEQIEKWFPNAKIVTAENLEMRKSDVMGLESMTIQISKVEALLTQGKEYIGRKVPPQVLSYFLKNNTNVFLFQKVFEKVKNKENPNATTYAKNWLFQTEFELPGMLKWSRVIQQPAMFETSPIINTLTMLQDKNRALEMQLRMLEKDENSVDMGKVGQELYGVVLASVGGGIPKIEEAFLTPEYDHDHPEEKDMIEDLKQEIINQHKIVGDLLPIHERKKHQSMEPMHLVIEEQFLKSKAHVDETYGSSFDNTFKESALNKALLRTLQ